jgi:hypothetical protein
LEESFLKFGKHAYLLIGVILSFRCYHNFVIIVIGPVNYCNAFAGIFSHRLKNSKKICVKLFSIRGNDTFNITIIKQIQKIMLGML